MNDWNPQPGMIARDKDTGLYVEIKGWYKGNVLVADMCWRKIYDVPKDRLEPEDVGHHERSAI